ncbi:hypothetical protein [Thiocystis violacea]|uniref:hypothetical protein n=1 Tax=Thiocystis violacea TaxID=13725 RepID=UPI0019030D08|nr:hypothetical protein [Thiocystis violacea]MBK1716271.1 hypothetical protein [Thiocystis violacea]
MTFEYEDLARHFGRLWPVHVEAFSALLIVLRRQFGGDLDRMLVLAIIGSRTLPPRHIDGLSYDEFMVLARNEQAPDPDPINLQSIADCSGIPRETVRRKVRDLEAAGWLHPARHPESPDRSAGAGRAGASDPRRRACA